MQQYVRPHSNSQQSCDSASRLDTRGSKCASNSYFGNAASPHNREADPATRLADSHTTTNRSHVLASLLCRRLSYGEDLMSERRQQCNGRPDCWSSSWPRLDLSITENITHGSVQDGDCPIKTAQLHVLNAGKGRCETIEGQGYTYDVAAYRTATSFVWAS